MRLLGNAEPSMLPVCLFCVFVSVIFLINLYLSDLTTNVFVIEPPHDDGGP